MLASEKDSPRLEKTHRACAPAALLPGHLEEMGQEGTMRGILSRGCHTRLDTREKLRRLRCPSQGHFPRAGRHQGQRQRVTCDEKWRALNEWIGVAVSWALIPHLCRRLDVKVKRRKPLYAQVSYQRQQRTSQSHGK